MRWSFSIARIAGIDVRLHITFLLLLLFFAVVFYFAGGIPAAVGGLAFICLLFLCVLLHEFGHALAARWFGIPTPEITLLPIGGVARMARMPEKPHQELIVALAGPAVNVVIAAVLLMILGWTIEPGQLERLMELTRGEEAIEAEALPAGPVALLLLMLAVVNIFLVAFNLLPAFPMDGGRVLRAILASMMGHVQATQIAATVGQGMAVLFGLAGLFLFHPLLILIAVFVWIGAEQEATAARMRGLARDLYVRDAMLTRFDCLGPDQSIEDAVNLHLRATQRDFPIVDESDRLIGVLTRDDIIAALREHGAETPIRDLMRRDVPTVEAGANFDEAFRCMQEQGCPLLAVLDHTGRLVGMITPEHVGELMMIRSARNADLPWRRQ